MNEKLEKRIDMIKNLIAERLSPQRIILFGSLAKEMPTSEFDIDIFVDRGRILSIRDERKLKEEIEEIAGIYSVDMVFSYRVEKDFLKVIENTGVVLYEKDRG